MSCMFKNRLDSEEYDEYMNKGNEDREETVANLSEHYHNILKAVGEDPTRQGLLKTPERAAKAFRYYTCGYNIKLEGIKHFFPIVFSFCLFASRCVVLCFV